MDTLMNAGTSSRVDSQLPKQWGSFLDLANHRGYTITKQSDDCVLLSEFRRAAIDAIKENWTIGVKLAIATGRNLREVRHDIKLIKEKKVTTEIQQAAVNRVIEKIFKKDLTSEQTNRTKLILYPSTNQYEFINNIDQLNDRVYDFFKQTCSHIRYNENILAYAYHDCLLFQTRTNNFPATTSLLLNPTTRNNLENPESMNPLANTRIETISRTKVERIRSVMSCKNGIQILSEKRCDYRQLMNRDLLQIRTWIKLDECAANLWSVAKALTSGFTQQSLPDGVNLISVNVRILNGYWGSTTLLMLKNQDKGNLISNIHSGSLIMKSCDSGETNHWFIFFLDKSALSELTECKESLRTLMECKKVIFNGQLSCYSEAIKDSILQRLKYILEQPSDELPPRIQKKELVKVIEYFFLNGSFAEVSAQNTDSSP